MNEEVSANQATEDTDDDQASETIDETPAEATDEVVESAEQAPDQANADPETIENPDSDHPGADYHWTQCRGPAVELWTAGLALAVLVLGLGPAIFTLANPTVSSVFAAVGLLLSGLVLWASQAWLKQDRALVSNSQTVIEVSFVGKRAEWVRVRQLARWDDIIAVYLSPRVNLWSQYHEWIYPVVLLTAQGQSITVSNTAEAQDRENFSIPWATEIAEILGCDFFPGEEQTPVKVAIEDGTFVFVEKNQDVGWPGRILALSALAALIGGLWKLTT